MNVTSGNTARVKASTLSATGDLDLQATGDVVVESAQDTSDLKLKNYKLNTITQKSAELTAGGAVTVGSLAGDLSIIASKVDSGGDLTLNTPNGTLYLGARKDYREEHISDSKSGAFITTYSNRGTIDETVVPTLLTAGGNIAIVTGDGIIVDYKDTGSFTESIDQLSQAPGLAWMADLRARNDVSWNAVQEAHQSWDYRTQGISPTGAALISLAVAWATAGMGSQLAGMVAEGSTAASGMATGGTLITSSGTLTVTNASLVAAVDAGFTSLVSQAAQALVGNGGDIGATLKQLGSSSTLKTLATSMITAGLMEGLPMEQLGLDGSKTAPFAEKLKYNIATASIRSTVDSVINGTPLTENLKNGLVNAAVTVVGAEAAHQIGLATASGDINTATQLIAHAALGCAMGAANGDCQSGAIGGVAGELTAWGYQKMTAETLAADIHSIQQSAHTPAEAQALIDAAMTKWIRSGVDVSRLSGALAAAAVGGDAQTAANTAENAADNNAFFLIPLIIFAASAGYSTYVGEGDPLQGLAEIGNGDDPLSQAISSGLESGVTLAMAEYPDQTQATLDVLEAFGNDVDAIITYADDATNNVVSEHWNALDPTVRNQLKGAEKIVSVALTAASVTKLVQVKNALSTTKMLDAQIVWKKGIQAQGIPWEEYLATQFTAGTRLPQGFKTFDFYDEITGMATSAKTLDTMTATRLNNPSTIYSALKGYIDTTAEFTEYSLSQKTILAAEITSRKIQLAVPSGTTAVQWQHLAQAIEYGKSMGVDVIITKVK